jgi:outer membrane lipase/esterase
MKLLSKLAITSAILLSVPAHAGSLFFFGDSLSDTGNLFTATGGAFPVTTSATPYATGQFTDRFGNGVWTSQFANALGQASDANPSLRGGNNFSFAGARTYNGPGLPLGLSGQVFAPVTQGGYLASRGPSRAEDLFTIVIGGNDLRDLSEGAINFSTFLSGVNTIDQAVRGLHADGARHFLLGNMPDVSQTPSVPAASKAAALGAERAWNNELTRIITGLQSLSGIDIDVLDLFGLANRDAAFYASAGITNRTESCFAVAAPATPATACPTYFFSDDLHPTAAAHGIIARQALSAIPVPGSLALIFAGLLAAVGFARKTRRV